MGKAILLYKDLLYKKLTLIPKNISLSKLDLSREKIIKIIIVLSVLIFIAFLVFLFKSSQNFPKNANQSLEDQRYQLQEAKAKAQLNHEFSFPLNNEKGVEVARIKYVLQNVELRDEIVVKGKKATAIKGRTFLIINLKIVNDFERSIEINTKDYIRLAVNGNEVELLAPDIHNDPVTIQAISTKYSRIGFPINDTDTNLKLKAGEINGEKQTIDINLQ